MAYIIAEPCIGTKDKACVDVCPVAAIFVLEDLPEQWANYTQINDDYFKPSTG